MTPALGLILAVWPLRAPAFAGVATPVRAVSPALAPLGRAVLAAPALPPRTPLGLMSLPFPAPPAPHDPIEAQTGVPSQPRYPAWDDARAVAERLADGRGTPREGHALFRENLARYLFNAYPDETLAALAARSGPLTAAKLPDAPRWLDKIRRDVEQPYSDAEVSRHLDRLQGELVEVLKLLREWSPAGGYTLTVMGGITRGRLSARSDLDIILRTEDEELFQKAMTSPFGYLVKERLLILSPPAHNKRVGRALGPMIDIGDGGAALDRPDFLRALYLEQRRLYEAAAPAREFPPEKLEVVVALKKLSKKRLKFAPGDPRRLEIEELMRRLSKKLEET